MANNPMRQTLQLALILILVTACPGTTQELRRLGQEDFLSAAPNGANPSGGAFGNAGAEKATDVAAATPPVNPAATAPREIAETDLYRVDGDRLYYLNGYRGLLIFDISNIDAPKLLGRSAIFGTPVEMYVKGGIATVVVADWIGALDSGEPFHGSIVRQLNATDPTNITVRGEAKLSGWVRDLRIVGDVLYAVSEDAGDSYGWRSGGGIFHAGSGVSAPSVIISSVQIAGGPVEKKTQLVYTGYAGIFNVSANAIMLARALPNGGNPQTELSYIDISDPQGTMKARGKITVGGAASGWGADNGRFNLDFRDGRYARLVACSQHSCGASYAGNGGSYVLQTVDFADVDAPVAAKSFMIDATGWSAAARFDGDRLYLAPSDGYYGSGTGGTPIRIFDLSNKRQAKAAGSITVAGNVWMFMPAGNALFALGSDYDGVDYGNKVTVHYVDVSDVNAPVLKGTGAFGDGWSWTPAADTFKAFNLDSTQGLVVLPFSGWSYQASAYNNGLQILSFDAASITPKGAAKTKGWTTRGVFAKGRLLSLSDLSLGIINYDDRMNPVVNTELTLARNVIDTVSLGDRTAQLVSDWWDNDVDHSTLRILPTSDVAEEKSLTALAELDIPGTNPRLFRNGDLAYIVTDVRKAMDCSPSSPGGSKAQTSCYSWTHRVGVVDLSTDPVSARGSVELPARTYGNGWGWGFNGCFYDDWYTTSGIVQVQGDALAFRRWEADSSERYDDAKHALYLIDLKDPDAPSFAATAVTRDTSAWWGKLVSVGNKLYASDWDWVEGRNVDGAQRWYVRYYANDIDISNRKAPKIGKHINVPGILVGGSEKDPSILYTIDYRWQNDGVTNEIAAVQISGERARLQGYIDLQGYIGPLFVRGDVAYATRQSYSWKSHAPATLSMVQLNLHDPHAITLSESTPKVGWGWLVAVEGDRAIINSGWGSRGLDIYRLHDGAAPSFDQTLRTRGYWQNAIHRDADTLTVSSGYWGVQRVDLAH